MDEIHNFHWCQIPIASLSKDDLLNFVDQAIPDRQKEIKRIFEDNPDLTKDEEEKLIRQITQTVSPLH